MTTPVYEDCRCINERCARIFTPRKKDQQSCSNRCAQAVWKRQNRKERTPEPWTERRKANHQKRRALKLQLPADDIRAIEVYERDRWVCGICDVSVDSHLVWPDPMSATLDHVIPLARGGHHVLDNVQLAHAHCNLSKGARFEVVNT